MGGDGIDQRLAEPFQIAQVLLEDVVNDPGIDPVVEMDHPASKSDRRPVPVGILRGDDARTSQGIDPIDAVLRSNPRGGGSRRSTAMSISLNAEARSAATDPKR
jgi:hypothetical protein